MVDDVEDEWLNGGDFDFVHLRNMITILKSPVLLLKQAYACVSRPNSDFLILLLTFIRNMKPGAWVELQDVDGQVHTDDDTIPEDWPLNASQSTSSKPLPSSKPMHMPLYLEASISPRQGSSTFNTTTSNFLTEHGQKTSEPALYSVPKKNTNKFRVMRLVGMYYRTACEEFFPAVGALHFPKMGWEKNEMEIFFAECRKSMRDPRVHTPTERCISGAVRNLWTLSIWVEFCSRACFE